MSYLSLVLEADLSHLHAAVLFEVRPGRVDDGDIVFLIPFHSVSSR